MPPGDGGAPASGSPASCRPLPAPPCRQGWRRSRWRSRPQDRRHLAGLAGSMPPGMAALPVALPAQDRRHLAVFCGTSMPPGMAALPWRRSRPSGSPASCRPLPASMPPGMAALPVALLASGSSASCRPLPASMPPGMAALPGGAPGLRIVGILPALAGHAARDGGAPGGGAPGLRIAGILPCPCRPSMPPGMAALPVAFPASGSTASCRLPRPLCRRDGGAPGGVPGLRIAGIL